MPEKMLDILTVSCRKISLPGEPFSISKPLELHRPPALGSLLYSALCSSSAPSQTQGTKQESPGLCCPCRVTGGNLAFCNSLSFPPSCWSFTQRGSKAQRWGAEVRCWDLGWKEGILSVLFPFSLDNREFLSVHPGPLGPPGNPPQPLMMLLGRERAPQHQGWGFYKTL